jgi:hypothetical protein
MSESTYERLKHDMPRQTLRESDYQALITLIEEAEKAEEDMAVNHGGSGELFYAVAGVKKPQVEPVSAPMVYPY